MLLSCEPILKRDNRSEGFTSSSEWRKIPVEINALQEVMKAVVEAARESLVIGEA
jgi:hypothetical protein